jgi:hypothetical protein
MNVAKAIEWLQKAIDLHARHMSGDAPTTGEAGEKSQKLMMDQMEKSLSFLQDKPASKMPAMSSAAMTQVRVNVSTLVNASKIRREKRDGRDVIIVPSATLPDDVVMNRVRYPADAIEASYSSLENTPAPLGHPTIDGTFVSASHPHGLVRGFVGAYNQNVRRAGGRVLIDKVIDVEFAKQLEGGKAVLNAIDKGDPIHTSTGLYCLLNKTADGDEDADFEASDILFDHDAILLGEEGAATPEQGVGMLVNKASDAEGNEIAVINSVFDEEIERDLYWTADSLLRTVERAERAPLIERVIQAIKVIVRGDPAPEVTTNSEEESMDKAQFDELSGKVDGLVSALGGIDEKIATANAAALANALKPVTDLLEANAATQKAKDDAERETLVNKVVEAGLLDEATAKEATLPVLNALAEKATPGTVIRVNGAAYKGNAKNDRAPLALKGE